MKRFIIGFFVLAVAASMVVSTLTFMQPLFYRIFPSDNDRHVVMMDVLNNHCKSENILVFGDSRTMFGVDTRIIRKDLNFPHEVFNLSSVGQTLYESGYFYGLIGKNTRAVIQCISPEFFSRSINPRLQDEKAYSMYLSGYRINESTRSIIEKYNPIFDKNIFINHYKSRSVIKSYIHSNILVPLLDNEASDKYAKHSRYFPNPCTIKHHPDYPVYKYDCSNCKSREKPISQLSFLTTVHDYFKVKGIVYIIVLMPVNPDECKECYADFKEYKRVIENTTNISVIDITDLIQDTSYYYDAIHVNKDGAKIISSQIAKYMLTSSLSFLNE